MKTSSVLIGILSHTETNLIGWVVISLFSDFAKNANETHSILFGIKTALYFVKGEVFFPLNCKYKKVFLILVKILINSLSR